AVDVKTKEILAMEVTTDDVHDSEMLPALVEEASKRRRVAEAIMDGAYDSSKAYRLFRRMGIKPIIKPRCNARADRGPPERRRAVRLIKKLGDEGWSRLLNYGRRWAAETAFSAFKREYGEYCMAKNIDNIENSQQKHTYTTP
ncbi:transposase, partial [Infirmifilum sp.]|uniref:transposase n=1 Tax=Infirmifilum sp. TaxID=2856575 RepID=UPI003D0D14EA